MNLTILDHNDLYRLPWTLPDNGISWLEPTSLCNLQCDGCYRRIDGDPHKTLEEVKQELDVFQRYRKSDCISIAGGDPLVYPYIVETVQEIRSRGFKPIINTNGKALTPAFLRELKDAGVFGFTFHVDSRQKGRGSWEGKSEIELNDLRLEYAEMLADAGGIACSFNSTVYEENLPYVPGMIQWAQKHIDIVHTMVFICFRHIVPDTPFDFYSGREKVDWQDIFYHSEKTREVEITSHDLVRSVRETYPDFSPAAYLNGTEQPDALKWLLTQRVGTKDKIYGYPGPKFMELLMSWHHLRKDKYLSYASPKACRLGRSTLMFLWPFDDGVRKAAKSYLASVLRNPFRIFRRLNMQTIMFIQPIDFMCDGGQSMCDGCPDITVYNGQLVWSCRMEERKAFGRFLRSVPKEAVPEAASRVPRTM